MSSLIVEVIMDVYADTKGKFLGRSGLNQQLNKSDIGGRFNTSSQIGASTFRHRDPDDSDAESSQFEDSVLQNLGQQFESMLFTLSGSTQKISLNICEDPIFHLQRRNIQPFKVDKNKAAKKGQICP